MASGLYPGIGQPMYRANATYVQEPVWAGMRNPTEVIPSGSSSTSIPLNAGITTSLNVVFASAPAGTAFSVMYDVTNAFSTEYAIDTVASVGSQTVYTWSTADGIELDGFIRITNSGGVDINNAYGQQRARMTG